MGLISQAAFSFSPLSQINSLLEKEKSIIANEIKESQIDFTQLIKELDDIKSIKLDKIYLNSIFLHSSQKYLKHTEDKGLCYLNFSLENKLLKASRRYQGKVSAMIEYKTGRTLKAVLDKDNYFEILYKKSCQDEFEVKGLFLPEKKKDTIEQLSITFPETEKSCQEVHASWIRDLRTIPICSTIESHKKALKKKRIALKRKTELSYGEQQSITRILSDKNFFDPKAYRFFENLCLNLDDTKQFCTPYLKKDIWSKIENKEVSNALISHSCRLLGIKSPTKCLETLRSNKDICSSSVIKGIPSLYPRQNCEDLSNQLIDANLVPDYKDCPGNFDNSSIINISRIINYKEKKSFKTTTNSCISETNNNFASLYQKFDNMRQWPLKVCYPNKITKEEECLKYIPGNNDNEEISENNIIAKIIYKNESALSNLKCKIVDNKNYVPTRLEYSTGCFVTYDSQNCSPSNCPKKIFYNKREITYIKYVGAQVFEYFPTNYMKEKFSARNILEEVYKYDTKNIKSYTELKFYLNNIKGIVHGVGCIEDILPRHFQRRAMNACTPVPFIVDGYEETSTTKFVNLRTALDDVHFPRKTLWNNLFGGIKKYERLHPLRTWVFYGIK